MRVAYLVNQYPKVSHTFIRREIEALESLGWQVSRFTVRRCAEELVDPCDREEAERTRVVLDKPARLLWSVARQAFGNPKRFFDACRTAWRLGRQSHRGVLRHFIYVAEACLLKEWLAEDRAEHIHAHFGTNAACVALLVHQLGGPPYSFTVHGPEEFDAPQALGLPEKIRQAAFVVAISEFGRSQIYRWSCFEDWQKIHIVHCGLDAHFLHAEPVEVADTARLVCVGRLCEQKGQLLLVQAVAQCVQAGENLQLVLVGDGPMRPEVEQCIRAHGLENHVTITGWCSAEEVRKHLLEARCMVLPSFAEGLPVVLMEALALRRPAISTYIAGIPELVRPGESGWLVPAGDVPALVEALTEALAMPTDQLQAMGENGARQVAERHDALTEAGKLARLMEGDFSQTPLNAEKEILSC